MGAPGGTVSIKSDVESQAIVGPSGQWYRTPCIGQHGWVTLDDPLSGEWDEVQELITDGYRLAHRSDSSDNSAEATARGTVGMHPPSLGRPAGRGLPTWAAMS